MTRKELKDTAKAIIDRQFPNNPDLWKAVRLSILNQMMNDFFKALKEGYDEDTALDIFKLEIFNVGKVIYENPDDFLM